MLQIQPRMTTETELFERNKENHEIEEKLSRLVSGVEQRPKVKKEELATKGPVLARQGNRTGY